MIFTYRWPDREVCGAAEFAGGIDSGVGSGIAFREL